MQALLLLALLTSPDEPAAQAREQLWSEQIARAYEERTAGNFDEALRLYSDLLEQTEGPPEGAVLGDIGTWREEWLWQHSVLWERGTTYLEAGQPDRALLDFETFHRVYGGDAQMAVLEQIADAYDALGQPDQAAALRQQSADLAQQARDRWEPEPRPLRWLRAWLNPSGTGPSGLSLLVAAGLVALIVAGLLTLINVVVGRRQRKEGGGTVGRLWWVAAVVAGLQTLPLLAGLLVAIILHDEQQQEVLLTTLPYFFLFNVLTLFPALKPPARLLHTKEALPLVEDAPFQQRVTWLAGQLDLPPPPVRLIRSVGGELSALALAGGLVSPSLVVTDGILHRLASDERDAIIGHELAHLANHSLWFLVSVCPIAMTGGVLMSAVVSPAVAMAFSLLLYVGLQRMVSRHFEYDCDRRAAEVIGFPTMMSALTKIHAAHVLSNTGWLSTLLYATATHPSRDERLAALADAAPPDDRPPITWSVTEVRWRRWGTRLAGLAWLAGLIGWPLWYLRWPSWVPVAGLAILGMIPWILLLIASLRATRFERRRQMTPTRFGGFRSWAVLLVSLLLVAVWWGLDGGLDPLMEDVFGNEEPHLTGSWSTSLVGGLLLFLTFLMLPLLSRSAQLKRKVNLAVQRHDFAEVVRLCEKSPRGFARDPALRHAAAVSLALTGQREPAIDELRQLVEAEPKYAQPRISLSMLLCDEGEYTAALEANEPLLSLLPRDPAPWRQQAWCLRMLGRADEADEALQRAREQDPASGRAEAIAAALAIDRGDLAEADRLLKVAERQDPGTGFVEAVSVELALALHDGIRTREHLDRARAASRANPFALLDKYVAGLASRLNDAGAGGDVSAGHGTATDPVPLPASTTRADSPESA